MASKYFSKISDFKGKMSQINQKNPAAYERVQFMKLYSKIVLTEFRLRKEYQNSALISMIS